MPSPMMPRRTVSIAGAVSPMTSSWPAGRAGVLILIGSFACPQETRSAKNVAINTKNNSKTSSNNHEYILCYSKNKKEVEEAFQGKDATAIRESSIADMVVFYYAHPVTLNNQQYVLRLSVPQTTSIYFTTDIKNMLILTGCVILCFVLLFTSIICFNVIKGIKELEKASIEYKNGNFEYNPETESTKEISDLSKSFVNMAQSIKADKEKVLRLEKIRKDFVANVSHELKTPITSIKGFAETLLDGAIDDKETAINFVNIINNESGRIFAIIEDLLDLSRLEQENENISSVEMNLVPFLQGICKKYDIKKIHYKTNAIS